MAVAVISANTNHRVINQPDRSCRRGRQRIGMKRQTQALSHLDERLFVITLRPPSRLDLKPEKLGPRPWRFFLCF